jgi:hypothetical protein
MGVFEQSTERNGYEKGIERGRVGGDRGRNSGKACVACQIIFRERKREG